jgi:NAD(P)-dependent dehydrogenase (short-subunit alcohol dehydrogenase family)
MFMMNTHDKICLITGATSGIGKAAATALAAMGMTLILVGRNERRASEVLYQIRNRIGNSNVEFLQADLSDQGAVRELARKIMSKYDRLDILINNAGARFNDYRESVDGIELTFATNHLGAFLLTSLLIEPLKKSDGARVITVSSGTHHGVPNEFKTNWQPDDYNRKISYGQSKLANVMFTYELARRLSGTHITANTVDPGGVATNLGRNNGLIAWVRHLVYYAIKRELLSSRQGADTVVYLATSQEVEGVTGQYFFKRKPIRSSAVSYDERAAMRLWEISEKLVDKAAQAGRKVESKK